MRLFDRYLPVAASQSFGDKILWRWSLVRQDHLQMIKSFWEGVIMSPEEVIRSFWNWQDSKTTIQTLATYCWFFCGNSRLLCVFSIWHEILKTRLLTRIPTLWLSTIRIVTRLWWSEKSSHCNNQNCNCQNCDNQNCDGTFNIMPWASLRGVARSYQTINKSSQTLRNTPATLSYNPTLLQGTLIADITRFSGRCCALAITPWFYTTSFSSGWLLGACECCWLCRQCAIASVPSAKCWWEKCTRCN